MSDREAKLAKALKEIQSHPECTEAVAQIAREALTKPEPEIPGYAQFLAQDRAYQRGR